MKTMILSVLARLALCLAAAMPLTAQPNEGLIVGLPPLKDPTVLALDQRNREHLLVAMQRGSALRAYVLHDGALAHEVELELPPLGESEVRWGPMLFEKDGVVYLYSGAGKWFNWPTYRLRVCSADREKDFERDSDGKLRRVVFHDERPLATMSGFPNPPDKYGIIDPEVVETDEGLVIYYTVVEHGIPGERYHQEWIAAEQLTSPTATVAGGKTEIVYFGHADPIDGNEAENVDDGVAEAPAFWRAPDGRCVLFFSSFPTENDQRMCRVESAAPFGQPWTNRRIIFAANPDVRPQRIIADEWAANGVGGQCVIIFGEGDGAEPWLLYQGLSGKTFRLALAKLEKE